MGSAENKIETPRKGDDKHDESVEQQDFFVRSNPATRKLGSLVSETYDAMVKSMASEIAKVLK